MVRIMAFNGSDWEPLDWDVPAHAGSVQMKLNHSTMITVTVPGAYNRHLFRGHPRLFQNMAHVGVEDDDGRVFTGIVKSSPLGDQLSVTAHGHSVLSKDFPWHGAPKSWTGVDGIMVFREVWDHIISNALIPRLEIVGASRGGSRVGKPASAKWQELTNLIESAEKFVAHRDNRVDYWERHLDNRANEMFRATGRRQVGEVVVATEEPAYADAGTYKAVIERTDEDGVVAVHFWEWSGVGAGNWVRRTASDIRHHAQRWLDTQGSLNRAKELYPTYVTRAEEARAERDENHADGAPEPYELTWWDARDLSSNLEEIRELGAFDWCDAARWDGDELIPQIRVLHGDRPVREDIHLEFGVNVLDVDELTPGESASHITVLGAGEGAGTIRSERRLDHPRMVPVYRTVSGKDYRTQQLADKAADKERDAVRRALQPVFGSLTVVDHPLAPISDFQLGDRVRVVGELVDGSDHEGVVRVTSVERDLGGKTLSVEVEHE